jgi:hypothetical protein
VLDYRPTSSGPLQLQLEFILQEKAEHRGVGVHPGRAGEAALAACQVKCAFREAFSATEPTFIDPPRSLGGHFV